MYTAPKKLPAFLTVLALAELVSPMPALAAGKTRVLVLPVQSEGLAAGDRDAATTVARDSLSKYPKLELLPTPKVDLLEVMLELECTDIDAECLQKIGKKYGGDQLVYVEAAPGAGGIALKMRLIDIGSGKVVKDTSENAAGKPELTSAIGKLAVATFGPLPVAKPPPTTAVAIEANVADAEVFLNGTAAGRTPLKTQLKPGRYTVRVVKKGYVELSQPLEVVAGKPLSVNLTLSPEAIVKPPDPPPDERDEVVAATPWYATWWFWTSVGVAVAGGITAGVLLSQDDEPAPSGVLNFGISGPHGDPAVIDAVRGGR